jgi:hypothetical protein
MPTYAGMPRFLVNTKSSLLKAEDNAAAKPGFPRLLESYLFIAIPNPCSQ